MAASRVALLAAPRSVDRCPRCCLQGVLDRVIADTGRIISVQRELPLVSTPLTAVGNASNAALVSPWLLFRKGGHVRGGLPALLLMLACSPHTSARFAKSCCRSRSRWCLSDRVLYARAPCGVVCFVTVSIPSSCVCCVQLERGVSTPAPSPSLSCSRCSHD